MSRRAKPSSSERPPPWRDIRILRIAFQLAVVGAVIGAGLWLADNLNGNLTRQGIRTDFGFLRRSAGFAIAESDFESSSPVWRALVVGVKNTVIVSGAGVILATIIGLIVGVARLSPNWLVARLASVFVETIRNIPVVIIIVFMYIAVLLRLPAIENASEWLGLMIVSNSGVAIPSLRGVGGEAAFILLVLGGVVAAIVVAVARTRRSEETGEPHHRVAWATAIIIGVTAVAYSALGAPLRLSTPAVQGFGLAGGVAMSPEFAALLSGLVIYTSSHIAEIVRGSILAVPKGQSEAARALGLTEFGRYRWVVLPQALRFMIPPLANQYLNLTKNSSLAVFVAFPEITRITRVAIAQGNPAPQAVLILMGVYLVLSLTISAITNLVNHRLAYVTR